MSLNFPDTQNSGTFPGVPKSGTPSILDPSQQSAPTSQAPPQAAPSQPTPTTTLPQTAAPPQNGPPGFIPVSLLEKSTIRCGSPNDEGRRSCSIVWPEVRKDVTCNCDDGTTQTHTKVMQEYGDIGSVQIGGAFRGRARKPASLLLDIEDNDRCEPAGLIGSQILVYFVFIIAGIILGIAVGYIVLGSLDKDEEIDREDDDSEED